MAALMDIRAGGYSLIAGALGLVTYTVLFPVLLPGVGGKNIDFVSWVTDPSWQGLCLLAILSLFALQLGLFGLYAHVRSQTWIMILIGFVAVQLALSIMICTLAFELCIYPVIGAHSDAATLLRDRVIWNDPTVAAFRNAGTATSIIGLLLFNFALFQSGKIGKMAPALVFAGAIGTRLGFLSVFVELAGMATVAIGCVLMGWRLVGSSASCE